jgi:hypothetical protein
LSPKRCGRCRKGDERLADQILDRLAPRIAATTTWVRHSLLRKRAQARQSGLFDVVSESAVVGSKMNLALAKYLAAV